MEPACLPVPSPDSACWFLLAPYLGQVTFSCILGDSLNGGSSFILPALLWEEIRISGCEQEISFQASPKIKAGNLLGGLVEGQEASPSSQLLLVPPSPLNYGCIRRTIQASHTVVNSSLPPCSYVANIPDSLLSTPSVLLGRLSNHWDS